MRRSHAIAPLLRRLGQTLFRPQMLAFLPALVLAAVWYGGEGVLVLFAVTFPMVLLVLGMFDREHRKPPIDPLTGLPQRAELIDAVDAALSDCRGPGVLVFALQIDDASDLRSALGSEGFDIVLQRVADRLASAVRRGDMVARLEDHRFGLLLAPIRGNALDIAQMAAERLKRAVAEPIGIDGASAYASASVGVCLTDESPGRTGPDMLHGAQVAMDEAVRAGPGSVRVYSEAMGAALRERATLAAELDSAFQRHEIRPWFQPQISAATGAVTGMEALARWHHPERGVLSPGAFLPAIEASGQLERLGEAMLHLGLSALRDWDLAGFFVPHLGINFSATELRNPRLADRIRWELDRFDIAPERLAIEVLETVVAGSAARDTVVTDNIAALSELGCTIDLDDFGTGHASIANVRRFAVGRIKIDRSFVTGLQSDLSQQKVVSAILSMAGQLELETVAEGVETEDEQAFLARMGCTHLQGFGIARPMPPEDALAWMRARSGNARPDELLPSAKAV